MKTLRLFNHAKVLVSAQPVGAQAARRPANRCTAFHRAQEAQAEVMRLEALKLRVRGLSERQIAAKLGVSRSSAHNYLRGALNEVAIDKELTVAQLRELEGLRLDECLQAVMPYVTAHQVDFRSEINTPNGKLVTTLKSFDALLRAVDAVIKISARRSALYGLDAPKESHHAVVQVPPPMVSDEELAATMQARQAILAGRARPLLEAMPGTPDGTAREQVQPG